MSACPEPFLEFRREVPCSCRRPGHNVQWRLNRPVVGASFPFLPVVEFRE